MHKYSYYPDTATIVHLATSSNVVYIPVDLYTYLRGLLTDDDWTYLRITFAKQVEVVKVIGFIHPNRLVIVRGQDNTQRAAFPSGSIIGHVATVAGVIDTFSPVALNINTLGAVSYDNGEISIPEVNIIGLGGMGIPNSAALRCCPVDAAPKIPLDLQPLRIDSAGRVRLTSDNEYRVWR